MSEVIRLQFRKMTESLTVGAWLYRNVGGEKRNIRFVFVVDYEAPCDHLEYAGPFKLEIVEPDPEPLRIEGFSDPQCSVPLTKDVWSVTAHSLASDFLKNFPLRALGSTRREAIERFNILARAMGATMEVAAAMGGEGS